MESYEKVRSLIISLYNDKKPKKAKKKIYNEYLIRLRMLAYKGHPEAQYDLAQHYEDYGFWGNPNPYYNNNKRFYWYGKAASNNHAEAYNNLADLFERGDGCHKNLSKAMQYYKKAMELGSDNGKRNYQLMLREVGHFKRK